MKLNSLRSGDLNIFYPGHILCRTCFVPYFLCRKDVYNQRTPNISTHTVPTFLHSELQSNHSSFFNKTLNLSLLPATVWILWSASSANSSVWKMTAPSKVQDNNHNNPNPLSGAKWVGSHLPPIPHHGAPSAPVPTAPYRLSTWEVTDLITLPAASLPTSESTLVHSLDPVGHRAPIMSQFPDLTIPDLLVEAAGQRRIVRHPDFLLWGQWAVLGRDRDILISARLRITFSNYSAVGFAAELGILDIGFLYRNSSIEVIEFVNLLLKSKAFPT